MASGWLGWKNSWFSLSQRSVYRYMKASEFAQNCHVANLTLSNLSPTTLYALSDGEYSPAAVQAILEEATTKRVGSDRAAEIALPIWEAEHAEERAESYAEALAEERAKGRQKRATKLRLKPGSMSLRPQAPPN